MSLSSNVSPSISQKTLQKSSCKTPAGGGAIYVCCKFQHFLQMLWLVARIENIVKHYVQDWWTDRKRSSLVNMSLQDITSEFSQTSLEFARQLGAIFRHGVQHVYSSLNKHLDLDILPEIKKRKGGGQH
jgi:hypothetical protein